MATNVTSNSLVYRQANYTTVASGSVQTKTFTNPAYYVLIANVDSSNDASISFDGGSNFLTLKHGVALELWPAAMRSYMVQDAVDNSHASIQTLYGSEK